MFRPARAAVLIAALIAAPALPLAAKTLQVTQQGANAFVDAKGKNGWYESVAYKLNGSARSAAAGLFRLTGRDALGNKTSFVAVCLEPLEWLRLPKTYSFGTPLGRDTVAALGALLDNALGKVRDARSAAAFQLAAWEIANESAGQYNLGKGAFQVTTAQTGTSALAQGWLDNIRKGTWVASGRPTILTAPGTQDLLTDMAPVPVPAAGLLMVGGIASLFGLRRRRTAR